MSTIRLETLSEHHIDSILEIEKESNSSPWSERAFKNELDNPQSCFIVAIADGKLVGYGGYWRCIDEAHITNIAVHPQLRQKGTGRKMMTELLRRAKEVGMTCSTLEVRSGNLAAIRLYESLGYKTTAVRKGYYPDNREDALVMWLYGLQD